jgi:flagellar hook-basal body complex protein FliE
MNPLSALRAPITSDIQANALARTNPGMGAIPSAELEKLSGQSGAGLGVSGSDGPRSFSNFLGQMVQEVNTEQTTANQAVNGLISGQNVSLHQAMIAMEEASVSFQLMVEVRNRLLDSYQELMRMQV